MAKPRVLRVYNLNGNVESTTVRCDIPAHNWAASDLNERWPESGIHTCDKPGQFELTLNPHEIQTILLRTQEYPLILMKHSRRNATGGHYRKPSSSSHLPVILAVAFVVLVSCTPGAPPPPRGRNPTPAR